VVEKDVLFSEKWTVLSVASDSQLLLLYFQILRVVNLKSLYEEKYDIGKEKKRKEKKGKVILTSSMVLKLRDRSLITNNNLTEFRTRSLRQCCPGYPI